MAAVEQAAIRDLRNQVLRAPPVAAARVLPRRARPACWCRASPTTSSTCAPRSPPGISNLVKDSLTLLGCLMWVFLASWQLALLVAARSCRRWRSRWSRSGARCASARARRRSAWPTSPSILQETIVGRARGEAFGHGALRERAVRRREPALLPRVRAPAPRRGGGAAGERVRDRGGRGRDAVVRRARDLRDAHARAAAVRAVRDRAARHDLADQEPVRGQRQRAAGHRGGGAHLRDARHAARRSSTGPAREGAAAAARRDPLRGRVVRLPAGRAGAARRVVRDPARRGGGAGRLSSGAGQEHGDGPAGALPRSDRGPHHDRRRRPARRDARLAARAARHRDAGDDPVPRHGARQHRLRPARRAPTRGAREAAEAAHAHDFDRASCRRATTP